MLVEVNPRHVGSAHMPTYAVSVALPPLCAAIRFVMHVDDGSPVRGSGEGDGIGEPPSVHRPHSEHAGSAPSEVQCG